MMSPHPVGGVCRRCGTAGEGVLCRVCRLALFQRQARQIPGPCEVCGVELTGGRIVCFDCLVEAICEHTEVVLWADGDAFDEALRGAMVDYGSALELRVLTGQAKEAADFVEAFTRERWRPVKTVRGRCEVCGRLLEEEVPLFSDRMVEIACSGCSEYWERLRGEVCF